MGNEQVNESQHRSVQVGLWEALKQVAYADGYAVEVRPSDETWEAFADYDSKRIVVSDGLDEETAVARLAHEIGHVRMHSPGDWLDPQSTPARAVREVEAESVAYLVMSHHGVPMGDTSREYMADWLMALGPGSPAEVLMAIGPRIVQTAGDVIRSTAAHMEAIRRARPAAVAASLEPDFHPPELDGPAMW